MSKLDEKIMMNRLAKIKYLYKIGVEQSLQVGMFAGFSILSFHDCAEMFLLLVLENNGDSSTQKDGKKNIQFMQYWDMFKNLTLRESMNMLKERRRNIKHKGLFPSKSDIEESRITITNFLRENTLIQFGIDFETLSISDLIVYPNIKEYVKSAESFLSQDKTYDCLVNIKIGFEELLATYESDKEIWDNSILNVGERVGDKYRQFVNSNKVSSEWFRQITNTTNAIRDILKVTALGIDYKKYALFNFITPRVLEGCNENGKIYCSEQRENYEKRILNSREDCWFCINFVIDCALKLQEFNYDINKYLHY